MNHEPNATVWKMGDLVIHDDDAKRPDMLMKVLSRIASGPRKGMFRTRYAYPELQPKSWRMKVWINPIEKLHDPKRFAIDTTRQPRDRFSRDLDAPPAVSVARSTNVRPQVRLVYERSPYREALEFIRQHQFSGSAATLAKLVLSLWNSDAAFSFRECVSNLDEARTAIALRCVAHFAKHGEDGELVEVGYAVHDLFPRLWELGAEATEAKSKLRQKWEDEARRREAQEERYS